METTKEASISGLMGAGSHPFAWLAASGSFGTLGYLATGDAIAVQKRLVHSSVATTMQIYAYLLRDDASVAAAVDGLLTRPTE